MRKIIFLTVVAFTLSGCVPVLVGGLIIKSSKTKGQKQEFMSQLQQTNTERELNGLEPLDWCSEVYRFDKGWAMEDPGCAQRITAYEAGDAAALGRAELAPAETDSVSAPKQP